MAFRMCASFISEAKEIKKNEEFLNFFSEFGDSRLILMTFKSPFFKRLWMSKKTFFSVSFFFVFTSSSFVDFVFVLPQRNTHCACFWAKFRSCLPFSFLYSMISKHKIKHENDDEVISLFDAAIHIMGGD